MIDVLVFSSLYPNVAAPNFGIFVENRTRRLAETGEARVQVVAPVMLPPPPLDRHPVYRHLRDVPEVEMRHGLTVHHPRVPIMPAVGWRFSPWTMTLVCQRTLARLHQHFAFQVIDAHYFYPDGVAAARLGARFDVPVVITARGADITAWPKRPFARQRIQEAGSRAAGVAGVCQSLVDDMVALGMDRSKAQVLRNGVDLEHFSPGDREAARQKFGVSGQVIVSVGALIPRKAHHLTIAAVEQLPGVTALIAGQGPEHEALSQLIARLGVGDRVKLLGPLPHRDLPALYAAADLSVLASSNEGLANVLLESIACGTPVVATRVDGAPEVLEDPRAGTMVPVGDCAALTAAIASELANPRSRTDVRLSAERFDWTATTAAQLAQLRSVITRV